MGDYNILLYGRFKLQIEQLEKLLNDSLKVKAILCSRGRSKN